MDPADPYEQPRNPAPRRKAPPPFSVAARPGFTLVEGAVTVSLVVACSVLAYWLVADTTRAEARNRETADSRHAALRMLSALKKDLRSAETFEALPDLVKLEVNRLDGSGLPTPASVTFKRAGSDWERRGPDKAHDLFRFPRIRGHDPRVWLELRRQEPGTVVTSVVVLDHEGASVVQLQELVSLGAGSAPASASATATARSST